MTPAIQQTIVHLRDHADRARALALALEQFHITVAAAPEPPPAPVPITRAKPRRTAGIPKDPPKRRITPGALQRAGGNFGIAVRAAISTLANQEFHTHTILAYIQKHHPDLAQHPECKTRIAGILFSLRTAGEITCVRREKIDGQGMAVAIYRAAAPGRVADEWAKYREANPTPKLVKADDLVP